MRSYSWEPPIYYYTFGPHPPALRVEPPCRIETTTADAAGMDRYGQPIPPEKRHTEPGTEMKYSNPLTGPFYVEGAKPGDVVAVKIEEIAFTRDWAYSCFVPGFGALGAESTIAGATGLSLPLPDLRFVWKLDAKTGTGEIDLRWSRKRSLKIPLHPFLGCIGVAPKWGMRIASLAPGEHGGNMDCIETKPGTTIYLPVFVEGAYLFVGDCHAAQGDGECCGVALETTCRVILTVGLISKKHIGTPRLEDGEFIMAVGSARPLLDAYRISQVEVIRWLVEEYGFEQWEAFQVFSQVGRVRLGNVVDPNYSVVSKCPKAIL